jgi:hypothetical protein
MRAWFSNELNDIGGADLEVSVDGNNWIPIIKAQFRIQKTFQPDSTGGTVASNPQPVPTQPATAQATGGK